MVAWMHSFTDIYLFILYFIYLAHGREEAQNCLMDMGAS